MPWYSAGTVTVTNNSITVTGSGTQFSANVRVGDAFRGPDGGWYEVTNVASATVLSINPPYDGATASGAIYRIAPIQGYVKESADRLRMIVEQWGNELSSLAPWSTSPDADTALDELGASEVGKALIQAIDADTALDELGASEVGKAIIQAANAAGQRVVLELGTSATSNRTVDRFDTTSGRMLRVGDGGLLSVAVADLNADTVNGTQFFRANNQTTGLNANYHALSIQRIEGAQTGQLFILDGDASSQFSCGIRTRLAGGVWGDVQWIRHSGNTTVDSNGFLKNASPITKLYSNHVENNDQAPDVVLQKESTGVYRLLTERRLATEGWYIETPKDANGNIKVFIRYENTADGILIETFEPDYSTGPVTAGDPVDIPEGRWIDIRMTYTQAEIDAQNVIESTENNPQEADPDE